MKKSFIAVVLLTLLVSFAPRSANPPSFFRHIDITFTSPEGCIFRVVGEASINVLRLKLTSFTGTITMRGPAGCPQGTYNISYSSFRFTEAGTDLFSKGDDIKMEFNTDDLCEISSVKFNTVSEAQETKYACERVNNTDELKTSLIAEIKEGSCK